MWKWLEQYFTFTRGEKNGILLLILLSIAVSIVPQAYLYFSPVEHTNSSSYEKEVDAFIQEYNEKKQLALTDTTEDYEREFDPYSKIDLSSQFKKKQKKIEYFEFDPNKIGVDEWVKLGFSEKQAESIEKAKAKGWKFYKPEDLKDVYVVGEENYNRLASYIKIDATQFPKKEYPKPVYGDKPKEKFVVDINTADSSLFERQRGIGPSLASRIIKYRTRLGGFVSVSQISEIWGMPDSTYQSLKDRFVVKDILILKINVNTADVSTMGKHPYINYTVAKVIEAYRKQHGNYHTIEDLKKVPVLNDSIYRKMKPYVTVE